MSSNSNRANTSSGTRVLLLWLELIPLLSCTVGLVLAGLAWYFFRRFEWWLPLAAGLAIFTPLLCMTWALVAQRKLRVRATFAEDDEAALPQYSLELSDTRTGQVDQSNKSKDLAS